MENYSMKSDCQYGFSNGKKLHEYFIEQGQIIREKKLTIDDFPGMQKYYMILLLVATCSSQEEINRVLKEAGIEEKVVIVQFESYKDSKPGTELCTATLSLMTKDRRPCMII